MKYYLASLVALIVCVASHSALAFDPMKPLKTPPTANEVLHASMVITTPSNPFVASQVLPLGGDSFELILQIFPEANRLEDDRTICTNCFQRLAKNNAYPAGCTSSEVSTDIADCLNICSRAGAIIERDALSSLALSCISAQLPMVPGQM